MRLKLNEAHAVAGFAVTVVVGALTLDRVAKSTPIVSSFARYPLSLEAIVKA